MIRIKKPGKIVKFKCDCPGCGYRLSECFEALGAYHNAKQQSGQEF